MWVAPGMTVLEVMIPKTAMKMKETRNRRVKKGSNKMVAVKRRKKRVGSIVRQPRKKAAKVDPSKISLTTSPKLVV